MTRTISLVASLALAGLVLVPAALANHQHGDASVPVAQVPSPDVFERAVQSQRRTPTFVGSPDAIDRAIAARQAPRSAPAPPDAFERALLNRARVRAPQTRVDFWNYDPQTGAKIANTSPGLGPGELAEFYAGEGSWPLPTAGRPSLGTDPWLAQERRDLAAEANRALVTAPSPTSAGEELEWLQIGIGVAGGVLLAFGLVLGLRMVRIRPLAH
jgi:hypothetical protein